MTAPGGGGGRSPLRDTATSDNLRASRAAHAAPHTSRLLKEDWVKADTPGEPRGVAVKQEGQRFLSRIENNENKAGHGAGSRLPSFPRPSLAKLAL